LRGVCEQFGENALVGELPCAPATVTTYNAAGNDGMEYCYPRDCPEEPSHAAAAYPICEE